jgi:hypothetical protein
MGVHGRLFRNVASNLGNEILDNFEAEVQRDYINTKKIGQDEINKFNGEVKNLDAAYDNFGQMKNYMVNNPNLFPLNVPGADREMAVDKTLSLLFREDMDLFLGDNINVQEKIKKRFLNPIVTKAEDPYVPAATIYDRNKKDIRNKIGQISKIKKTTDLLTTMGEFNTKVDFAEEDYKTSIATSFMTANAYGIMGKQPTSQVGKDLLQIDQMSIIANNAKRITDRDAKQNFITTKLRENNINLEKLYMLENPLTSKVLVAAFQNEFSSLSTDLEEKRKLLSVAIRENQPAQVIENFRTEVANAQKALITATNQYSSNIAQNYLGKFDFGQVVEPKKSPKPSAETSKEIEQKMETKMPTEDQFMYNGKIYDIPPRFKGQKLTLTLKKALAAQQDNQAEDATP